MDSSDGCPILCMYFMPLNCTLKMVKMVSFILFYHNLKKVSQIVNVIPKDEFKNIINSDSLW